MFTNMRNDRHMNGSILQCISLFLSEPVVLENCQILYEMCDLLHKDKRNIGELHGLFNCLEERFEIKCQHRSELCDIDINKSSFLEYKCRY